MTICKRIHSNNKIPVMGKAIPVLDVKLKRGLYFFWGIFST